jgi:hypothetical protein
MPSYSPELIQTMRAALDEVITKVPVEQATPGIKAALAEYILRAAAEGQTKLRELGSGCVGSNSDNSFDADLSAGNVAP